jgi:acetolactate decarboxylase
MAIDPRLVSVLHLQALRHAALPAEEHAAHVAFQASTLEALLDGAYDGDLTIRELRRHGDLGLGTFDALDGEMIVVDGEVWRARADGTVERASDDARTPFAVVTPFTADATCAIEGVVEQRELLALVTSTAGGRLPPQEGGADSPAGDAGEASATGCWALRFDGHLDLVHARSVPPQPKPYPPLAEAAATQREFDLGPGDGSLVGFVFPSWAGGVELPGAHLHAITADRTRGGHVLHARVGPGVLRIAAVSDLHLELPLGVELPAGELDADRAAALDRLENR